jgi:hypothetical protein
MRYSIFAALAAATLALPAAARADGSKFGGAGQLAISDDQSLGGATNVGSGALVPTSPSSLSTASFQFGTLSNNGGSGTEFSVAPAADYFVIPNLSVGGNILFGVFSPAHGNSGPGTTVTLFGIAPRVGYNLPITDMISFWPKVYFSYVTANGSSGGNSSGLNASAIGVFAPLMFVPTPHFFLGIGPDFSTQLSNNETGSQTVNGVTQNGTLAQPKLTQVGLQATIGGWFLGD